jgi:glycosyltransferase involved in cell wall biosynthesis
MRIAFVTYEYPPDTGKGGIGTYTKEAIAILAKMGHSVELFCGTQKKSYYEILGLIRINRINTINSRTFNDDVLPVFEERHSLVSFEVLESPEINGNSIKIKERYPLLPLLVKLHTPAFLVVNLNQYFTPWQVKLRFFLGALRRGRIRFYGQYHSKDSDIDYLQTRLADNIVSPSFSLIEKVAKHWLLSEEQIDVVPNPYNPSYSILNYPIDKNKKNTVLFIGKLNEHKGIVNLVKAIPKVVKSYPQVKFMLIGQDGVYSKNGLSMSSFINTSLKGLENNYEITGPLEYDDVLLKLRDAEICIFPSIWENFPMVCLEAMSAGCAIIASNNGGMSELLTVNSGILINPKSVNQIQSSLMKLLKNDELRHLLAQGARTRVLDTYNQDLIGRMMEKSLQKAINNCALFNTKHFNENRSF